MAAGWTRDSSRCYLVLSERLTWNSAEQQCQVLGGHLTSVQSKEHVDWLWKLARRRHFWIGQLANLPLSTFSPFSSNATNATLE